ncbi:hypothetical protein [Mesorhizobium sp. B4-1-4]|uniref:hypothetical protein n=1 Tax=Mesorhizobium sp. B4-1-4 TaxID=2589888 RepID=UPI00112696D8|nr:hypothetical protein [Mesorhizobium sp. B4-1-4]UCI32544.1 hypothetical protein FJW03_03555 [Mesorhizobium sp. B4-1-4]
MSTETDKLKAIRDHICLLSERSIEAVAVECGVGIRDLKAFDLPSKAAKKVVERIWPSKTIDDVTGEIVYKDAQSIVLTVAELRNDVRKQLTDIVGLSARTNVPQDDLVAFAYNGATLTDAQITAIAKMRNKNAGYQDGKFVNTFKTGILGDVSSPIMAGPAYDPTVPVLVSEDERDTQRRRTEQLRGAETGVGRMNPAATLGDRA